LQLSGHERAFKVNCLHDPLLDAAWRPADARSLTISSPHLPETVQYPLREKLNDSGFEVVHRACNLYAAIGFKVPKHRAPFPNVGDGQ
jgi:hypothetical protein